MIVVALGAKREDSGDVESLRQHETDLIPEPWDVVAPTTPIECCFRCRVAFEDYAGSLQGLIDRRDQDKEIERETRDIHKI